ncbi:MAG: hypothetical protein JWN30_276 [Bacilli bacterium]|nr:hypothetical protein [Bacilli bacterium]
MLPDDKHYQYRLIGSKEEIERLAEQYDAGALLHAETWLNPSYLRVCGLLEQAADPDLRMHQSD